MKTTRRICAAVLAGCCLVCRATGFADQPKFSSDQALIAMGLCEDMAVKVNALVDYTSTKCIPNLSPKGTNFIFLSEQPVFSVEPSKKAWVIVVVLSVGRTLNDKPSYRADKILVADASMVPQKHFYVLEQV
jgi:hypothetical protein